MWHTEKGVGEATEKKKTRRERKERRQGRRIYMDDEEKLIKKEGKCRAKRHITGKGTQYKDSKRRSRDQHKKE